MKQSLTRKLLSLSLVLIIAILFSVTTDYFLNWKNICNLFREVAVAGLLSLGVTFVIIGGGIDLSTGAVMGLSGMIASRLIVGTLWPIWVIVAICLAAGLLCGFLNGILVTKFHLSEFIATFSSMFVYRGIVYVLAFREGGQIATKAVNDKQFLKIGGTIGGIYYMTFVWLAVVILGYFVLKQTKFGTYVYSLGANPKAAALTGIPVDKMKIATFLISAVLSALAGIFSLAWQGSVALDTGSGMEFKAIAAVVVGGVALTGGRGDTVGTAIGSVFMIMIMNGITKYNMPTEYQTIAYGVIIILMAIFDSLYFAMMDRRAIQGKREEQRREAEKEAGAQ